MDMTVLNVGSCHGFYSLHAAQCGLESFFPLFFAICDIIRCHHAKLAFNNVLTRTTVSWCFNNSSKLRAFMYWKSWFIAFLTESITQKNFKEKKLTFEVKFASSWPNQHLATDLQLSLKIYDKKILLANHLAQAYEALAGKQTCSKRPQCQQ